ncbi:uncharacterized protein N7506_006759 [Penicillium brevicompactum]|uniref:uncharacterized protein n=1 Tax=Penicillium brevicompactum TaxID=5074 RepID=UPI00253FDBF3|nr:uncharacterized protein N7506_006759 [Penicillium brevicompactum]KAJ5332976.1 hypothetical protein N7506_006759 [Penicillium brevicompactum]
MAEAKTFESPQVQSLGQTQRTMGGEHSHTCTHDLQLSPNLPEIVDERGLEPQQQYRPRYSSRQPSQSRQCSGQESDTSSSNEENTEMSIDDLWLPNPQSSSLCQLLYKKKLYIGSYSDVNRFGEITKLKGEQNWRQWKVDFFCTLWSVASIYGRIFSGQAEPPKEPQLLPASREAVINAAKKDKMAMSQPDEMQNFGKMLIITGKDFNDKLVELEVENNRRKNLYQKNTERWNMAIGRSRLFLRKCIGGLPKNSIYRIEDPRECYLLLEAQYGKPSYHCTVFRMKKWTEIRYKGTNPAGDSSNGSQSGSSEYTQCTRKRGHWGPGEIPPRHPKRQSVVLKIAQSDSDALDSDAKLNSDVRFWLNPDDGDARICLTIRVGIHTPAIRIEKWRIQNQNGRLHRLQTVQVTRVSGQTRVSDHPLVLPFEDLFLGPPSTPKRREISSHDQTQFKAMLRSDEEPSSWVQHIVNQVVTDNQRRDAVLDALHLRTNIEHVRHWLKQMDTSLEANLYRSLANDFFRTLF